MFDNANRLRPVLFEGMLARTVRRAAAGRFFLVACAALAFGGTLGAAFPVTAVIIPASLLAPSRWARIAAASALGSALGATALVAAVHMLGWETIHAHFPGMLTNRSWHDVVGWVADYGVPALFVIALSPLPQTPALVFLAIARHDFAGVFVAVLLGKLVKYAAVAWAVSRFPERFAGARRGERTDDRTGDRADDRARARAGDRPGDRAGN